MELTPETLASVAGALDDADPLVRRAAARALADADPRLRAQLLPPLVEDAVRAVRIEAAAAMAGVAMRLLPARASSALERATAEFVAAQELSGDRPEAHLNLAIWCAKQGSLERAESELRRALAIDPAFIPASVNLADLYRAGGRDQAGEAVLVEALARAPKSATLLYALGLVLVREKRLAEAIARLGAAARLAPDNARHGYVYAVALHDSGRKREAIRELERVLRRHPYDRDSLAALAAFQGDETLTRPR
jgi:tetratricopeptide (TPR) repeat protein